MSKQRVAVERLREFSANRQNIGLVDTFVRPQERNVGKSEEELAKFLEKASSQVAFLGRQKRAAEVETGRIAAQEFAYTNGDMLTFAQARESGELDVVDDPTVEMAYNKSIGIRYGRELAAKLQNKLEENRSTVLEMDGEQFDAEFNRMSAELMGDISEEWISQSGVRLGIMSHLNSVKNNAKQQHMAAARKYREAQLFDSFLEQMNTATTGVTDADTFARTVNETQAEMLNAESAYTGTQINEYMTEWLSSQIANAQDPKDVLVIQEAVNKIKAGSGPLGGTGVWQEASAGLVREASDRLQRLANRKYTENQRARSESIRQIEDLMTTHFQENGNFDNFELPEEQQGVLSNTETLKIQRTLRNLLETDEEEQLTLERMEELYETFAGMSEQEALDQVALFRSGDDDGFKANSMAEWNAVQSIALSAVRQGPDPYSEEIYRDLDTRITQNFDPIVSRRGGLIIKEQNRDLYNRVITDLRTKWLTIRNNPRELAEYIPEGFEELRNKPWRVVSKNPRVVTAIRERLLNEVESTFEYPAATEGNLTSGERTIGDPNDPVIEIETND